MRPLKLKMLSDEDIALIHSESLRILSEIGILIAHDETREVMRKAGCDVNDDTRVVKIPDSIVEECICSSPSTYNVYGRDGRAVRMVSDGSEYHFMNLGIGTRVCHYEGKGKFDTRDATLKDTEDIAKVADACENIDLITQPVSALDLMGKKCARTLHEVRSIITNTTKPYLLDPLPDYMDDYFSIMKACYSGDEEEARRKPFMIMGSCTSSPLQLDEPFCRLAKKSAELGFPFMSMTMAMAGTTAPVSLAGTITLHNVEALAGITVAQLYSKGTPCLYGSCSTGFDFKSNTAPFGSPENALIAACNAQLAQYYGIPSVNSGAISDSKRPDFQSALETTLTGMANALAGSTNIFGAGMIELGMTYSLEQAVMVNDLVTLIRRFVSGVDVNETSIAFDSIRDAGIGGEFIAFPETLTGMFEHSHSDLYDRSMYDEWRGGGMLDAVDLAHDRVVGILSNHETASIDPSAMREIDEIIRVADSKA